MTQKMRNYKREDDVKTLSEVFMVCYKCPAKMKLEVSTKAMDKIDETFSPIKKNLRLDIAIKSGPIWCDILDSTAKEFGLVARD